MDSHKYSDKAPSLTAWAFVTSWWMAVPDFPALLFGGASEHLSLTPAGLLLHMGVLALLLVGTAERALLMSRPEWRWMVPMVRLALSASALAILTILRMTEPVLVVTRGISVERYRILAHALNDTLSSGAPGHWLSLYLAVQVIFYGAVTLAQIYRWFHYERFMSSTQFSEAL